MNTGRPAMSQRWRGSLFLKEQPYNEREPLLPAAGRYRIPQLRISQMHFNLSYFLESLSLLQPQPESRSRIPQQAEPQKSVKTVKTVTLTLTLSEAEIYARALSLGATHYFNKSVKLSTHKENMKTADEMQKHFCFLMEEIGAQNDLQS